MSAGEPVRRLVVIGDSLAFTDAAGPQLPDAPHLYPNVLRDVLANATRQPWSVTVLARAGQDVVDTWKLVSKDRHAQFEVLPGADAVVVAIGSFDHAPFGVPRAAEALVPYLRPPALRRRMRSLMRSLYPRVAARTRRTRTPAGEFARLFDLVLRQVRGCSQGAAGVVLGPTSHRSAYYGDPGGRHPQLAGAERQQFEIAERHGFTAVPAWRFVEPFADRLNVDGIHWPAEAHAAVAGALAAPLLEQISGARPRPPWGDFDGLRRT